MSNCWSPSQVTVSRFDSHYCNLSYRVSATTTSESLSLSRLLTFSVQARLPSKFQEVECSLLRQYYFIKKHRLIFSTTILNTKRPQQLHFISGSYITLNQYVQIRTLTFLLPPSFFLWPCRSDRILQSIAASQYLQAVMYIMGKGRRFGDFLHQFSRNDDFVQEFKREGDF